MDNDGFETNTLTGASETNHRTNVMFVQNENLIDPNSLESTAPTLTKPKDLADMVEELNYVTPYKTTKNGDPPIREKFPIGPSDTKDIRADQLIHSLTRIDKDCDDRLPVNQKVGSFAGF